MSESAVIPEPTDIPRRRAVRFIVLIGLVSLFSDMTYESARSINGPFLAALGASATVVGIVAGLGEFVGYGIRLGAGIYADRSQRYWSMTIWGYVLNLVAVPLLALAGNWPLASVLIVLERMGRAIRSPARDALLSHAASRTGLGWGFGLHEALDQIGAVTGPVVLAVMLASGAGYATAYAWLAVPAFCAISLVLGARFAVPRPRDLEVDTPIPLEEGAGLTRQYWWYVAGASLLAAGFTDFQLIAYHFSKTAGFDPGWMPGLYALAMATDAVAALVLGAWFERARCPGAGGHNDPFRRGQSAGVPGRRAVGDLGHGVLGNRHGGTGIRHAGGGRSTDAARATRHRVRHVQRLFRQRLDGGQRAAGLALRPFGARHRGLRGRRAARRPPGLAVDGCPRPREQP